MYRVKGIPNKSSIWTKSVVCVVRLTTTMLCVECWVLDVGCWVLDVGCWMLGVGCWVLDVGCWVLGIGY